MPSGMPTANLQRLCQNHARYHRAQADREQTRRSQRALRGGRRGGGSGILGFRHRGAVRPLGRPDVQAPRLGPPRMAMNYAAPVHHLHADDRARVEDELRDAAAGTEKLQHRVPHRPARRPGEAHEVGREPQTRFVRRRSGRLIGVSFDITERKEAENKLIEANERFAVAAEAAGLGFLGFRHRDAIRRVGTTRCSGSTVSRAGLRSTSSLGGAAFTPTT
jgi:hypothetical protein